MSAQQTISDFLLTLHNFIFLRLALLGGLFHSYFPTKLLYALVVSLTCASCPAYFILPHILRYILVTSVISVIIKYVNVKGKIHFIPTGHEAPEGEWRYNSTLSLTLALDVGGWSVPHPPAALPPGMPH